MAKNVDRTFRYRLILPLSSRSPYIMETWSEQLKRFAVAMATTVCCCHGNSVLHPSQSQHIKPQAFRQ
jgi:hypothetical protein